jgi:hypothetical protein
MGYTAIDQEKFLPRYHRQDQKHYPRMAQMITSCHHKLSLAMADFGKGNIHPGTAAASKSALLFFATFFCRSKRK